ncbi:hypothetical protein [Lapidilactobacillus bayanensis]|uniref:hypothetical protein n=1 Tax=Lapidilactobacillus bayanensis TaxID=2485998 RepID=UPI000F7AA0CB|nr:hypothetical protein [Lapidilactobacillus bayanensis]
MKPKVIIIWLPFIHYLILSTYTFFFVKNNSHTVTSSIDLSSKDSLRYDPEKIGSYQLISDPLETKDPLLLILLFLGLALMLYLTFVTFRARVFDFALPAAALCLLIPVVPPFIDNVIMKLLVSNILYLLTLLLSAFLLRTSVKFASVSKNDWLFSSHHKS